MGYLVKACYVSLETMEEKTIVEEFPNEEKVESFVFDVMKSFAKDIHISVYKLSKEYNF